MKTATIKVPLTEFSLDIVIGGTRHDFLKLLESKYGVLDNIDNITDNECDTITTGTDSEFKGEIRFVLKLKEMPLKNNKVFIHELWHLMWHIQDTIGDLKLNTETQSWGACMIEELFDRIVNAEYK